MGLNAPTRLGLNASFLFILIFIFYLIAKLQCSVYLKKKFVQNFFQRTADWIQIIARNLLTRCKCSYLDVNSSSNMATSGELCLTYDPVGNSLVEQPFDSKRDAR